MTRIKLAFTAPLTGNQSIVAQPMLAMLKKACASIILPHYEVEVEGFDDAACEKTAIEVARKIVSDDKILAVVGHKNSGCLQSTGKIYEDAKMAFITPSATNYELSTNGWSGFFRLCAHDRLQAQAAPGLP